MSLECYTLHRDYAAIVFFANSRFETGKRKLQYLSFQDFAFCAGQLISYWTVGAVGKMHCGTRLSLCHKVRVRFFFGNSPEDSGSETFSGVSQSLCLIGGGQVSVGLMVTHSGSLMMRGEHSHSIGGEGTREREGEREGGRERGGRGNEGNRGRAGTWEG